MDTDGHRSHFTTGTDQSLIFHIRCTVIPPPISARAPKRPVQWLTLVYPTVRAFGVFDCLLVCLLSTQSVPTRLRHAVEVHGLVGEGEFGKVLMATRKEDKQLFAMKVLRKEHLILRGETMVAQAITEKQILQEMAIQPHPFVVSLHYAFQTDDCLYLLMDFVGGGDLFALIEARGALPEPAVQIYSAELALALEHVHSLNIIYRDLKPENIMVGIDGHLKLTDFGMSKRLEGIQVEAGSQRRVGIEGTICGTPEYIAPEVLQGKPYSSAIDWWTLGCLVYEMIIGKPPFRSADVRR